MPLLVLHLISGLLEGADERKNRLHKNLKTFFSDYLLKKLFWLLFFIHSDSNLREWTFLLWKIRLQIFLLYLFSFKPFLLGISFCQWIFFPLHPPIEVKAIGFWLISSVDFSKWCMLEQSLFSVTTRTANYTSEINHSILSHH